MCYTITITKYFYLFAKQKPLHHNSVLITNEVRSSLSLCRSSDSFFLVLLGAYCQLSLAPWDFLHMRPATTVSFSHSESMSLLSGLIAIHLRYVFHTTKSTYLTVLFLMNLLYCIGGAVELSKIHIWTFLSPDKRLHTSVTGRSPFPRIPSLSPGHPAFNFMPILIFIHPTFHLSESCNTGCFYLPKPLFNVVVLLIHFFIAK